MSVPGFIAAERDGGWSKAMHARLLNPLRMTRTLPDAALAVTEKGLTACHECEFVGAAVDTNTVLIDPNTALMHVDVNGRLITTAWRPLGSASAAQSVMSTARDMARYLQMILAGGTLDGQRIVRRSTLNALFEPRIAVNEPYATRRGFGAEKQRLAGWETGAGLGWFTGRYGGEPAFSHGGGSLGFESYMTVIPSRGIGVVVLSNYGNWRGGATDAVMFAALDHALGLKRLDWPAFFTKKHQEAFDAIEAKLRALYPAKQATPPSAPFTAFAGDYCNAAFGRLTVLRTADGQFELNQGAPRRGRLGHANANTFVVRWAGPMNKGHAVHFGIGADGTVEKLTMKNAQFDRCAASLPN